MIKKWVYPHVYGATFLSSPWQNRCMGLSPCVWGHRYACNTFLDKSGSIPMCMGPPCTESRRPSHSWVYPHVYGATQTNPLCRPSFQGLPQCVWVYLHAPSTNLTLLAVCL